MGTEIITSTEASKILGVSTSTVARRAKAGQLPVVGTNRAGHRLFDRGALVQMAAGDETPARPPARERGHSGVMRSVMGVYAMAERIDYNADMRPPTRWSKVEQMRKGDGSIKAALLAVTLPLLSVEWRVSPATDDPRDEEMAEFLEADLKGMSTSWPEYLREVLIYLADGVRPYEPVWEMRDDGMIHLRKMAARPPATVHDWDTDEHGGPAGIVQLDPDDNSEIYIPIQDLVVFIHEREGANWMGNSILRAAYKHWWFAEELERIAAIAVERGSMGVPVFEVDQDSPASSDGDETDRLEEIGMGLHAHENMFVRLPAGVRMKLQGVDGNLIDPMPLILHHKREALKSLLAQFITVGSGDVGSWAAAREHTSFFVMLLDSIAQLVAHVHRRYLFLRWCRWNWDPAMTVDQLPTLEYGKLETRDVSSYLDALVKAIDNKLVPTTRDVRRLAMDYLDLPALSEEEWDALEEEEEARREQMRSMVGGGSKPKPGGEDGDDGAQDEEGDEGSEGKAPAQPVQMAEGDREAESLEILRRLGIDVDFDALEKALDEAEQRMVERAQGVQERQIASLIAHARAVLRDNNPEAIASAQVRFTDEMAEAFEAGLEELYEVGAESTRSELESQGLDDPEEPEDEARAEALALLAGSALTSARVLSDRLLTSWQDTVRSQMRRGSFDGPELRGVLKGLSDKEIAKRAGLSSSEALGQGRRAANRANEDRISHYINSEVMDKHICENCIPIDGQRVEKDEAGDYEPYKDCLGGVRCRGRLVAVVK